MRFLVIVLSLVPSFVFSQEKLAMEPGPKSPEDSLRCIKTRPGFKVELMACEPAVMDPIAFAWGPDGTFWVVEMGDYPLGVDGAGKKGGRIKILTKSKADGLYDKATVFLDNLGYPTGVFPYMKGVLITCAPDILYAEDIDGDGKADEVRKVFTGFKEGNQQHRVNGLVWGLDNWIYGANGDSGGTITSIRTKKEVNINGRDFRFRMNTGEFEAVTGQTQFGRCRDDWGNWFGNNNTNPMFHYVLEDRYLRRNPALLFADVKSNVSDKPGPSQVFPISKPLPRFNTPGAVNHFTSACSTIIYRDDLFGKAFEGNAFISEPVHNLIHREIMRPDGITFRSKRADDEQESEFLASSDNWFRPTMIQTGPDGALWIADMYRYVIEHPEWIPKEWQAKLDLRAGHDKGRIYRVYPTDKKPRTIPNLAKLSDKDLVAALDSPSGWQRDTAHQMLVTLPRKKENEKAAAKELTALLFTSKRPQTRVHALMALPELQDVSIVTVSKLLRDEHPAVRKHAIQVLEGVSYADIWHGMKDRLKDEDPQVLLQLAYSIGEFKDENTSAAMIELTNRFAKDRRMMAALLSSINDTTALQLIHRDGDAAKLEIPDVLIENMLRYQIARGKGINPHLFALGVGPSPTNTHVQMLVAICDGLEGGKTTLEKLLNDPRLADGGKTTEKINSVFAHARRMAGDAKTSMKERLTAIRLLGRGLEKQKEDARLLETWLDPTVPDELQQAALTQLTRVGDEQTPMTLIKKWPHFTPGLRGNAFDALLARSDWTTIALIHLETKRILPAEIDATRRQRLLTHSDREIRARAEKVLAGSTTKDRAKAINEYLLAVTLEGDAKRGAKTFMRVCASCHRLGEIGNDVGPPLASVGDRTPGGLLNAILDPNRAVEPRYLNYLAVTKAGVSHVGILASETSTSITLVAVDGKKTDILRGDLDELTSTGKSAMPEGLEKDIPLQEMADLLAYLTSYLPPKMERPEPK